MEQLLERTKANLESMGFNAYICQTKRDAIKLTLELIGDESVGFGGSDTVESLQIYEKLHENGNVLFWKRKHPAKQHDWVRHMTMLANWYVLSANALTVSGKIINIDGHGNRVAASIYGPRKVLYLVGANKIVDGSIQDGINRAHQVACAALAKKRNRKTPCALTGECIDCKSPDRSCRATVIIEKPMTMGQEVYIILIGEYLGL